MKYDLIAEAYLNLLIEGRIDDLKSQNPHLVNEIDSYVQSDPTPQKKFVPWLVSQHKKGNVTPDEPSLNQTLSGFETYKSRHGIRDHSSKSYQEIRDAVQPFLGTATTNKDLKKQQIHEGIDQIYSSPDNKIQAFYVKTKEASQHVYGGGKELGGLHTGWCVAARSKDCMFGHYGTMYTIHVKGDQKSPYAVHLGSGSKDERITTRDNSPDEYELNEGLKKFPHLKDAVDKIKDAHVEIKKTEDAEFLRKLKNNDQSIRMSDIYNAARNPNPEVAMAALRHSKADSETTYNAARNPNPEVVMAAIRHPEADNTTTRYASLNNNPEVAMAVLNHPNADNITTQYAAEHPNPEVAMAALRHPKSDSKTARYAARNPNPEVAMAALNHPKADDTTMRYAARHSNPEVAMAALRHPKADSDITYFAAEHPNPEVAMAALRHSKADSWTTQYAATHPNPEVALAALNHANADNMTTRYAAEHSNPEVAMAALRHPKADDVTTHHASKHPDQRVRELAQQL